jgi:hypothetical protein
MADIAYAEDDEDEDEDEDEEDEDDDEEEDEDRQESTSNTTSSTSPSKARTQVITRYEVRKVTRVIEVTPPEYTTDGDGDGLVDALDPHPTIPETRFFTDTDEDSVPDAFDQHPGEDDFLYLETANPKIGQ